MKEIKSLSYFVVGLLLFSSFVAIGIGKEASVVPTTLSIGPKNIEMVGIKDIQKAIHRPVPTTENLQGNVLISADNPDGDDIHPRLCQGAGGVMVVVYEMELGIFSKPIPVVWSDDGGESWTTQFIFDSIDFTEGSGILQYPDIVYNSNNDVYFLTMVDPLAEMYNNEMSFISGDITTAEEAAWYGLSGTDTENYYGCACTCTENFFLSMTTEDSSPYMETLGLYYATYPDFENPPTMGGFYYDGNSEHIVMPASEIEMDTGGNRIFLVAETGLESGPKITVKSTVSDETLLTNGEQQHGMDKYADIEQWPGEYIADGADPDVSSSGNNVVVVYMGQDPALGDQNIKCAYSSNDGETWDISDAAAIPLIDEMHPAVYMSGSTIRVAYVSGGNLYSTCSNNGGTTWADPKQINEVDGTVVEQDGSIDLSPAGIVWTDSRNGNKDVYFSTGGAPNQPSIPDGPTSGKTGTSHTYSTSAVDPNGDDVSYGWDWDGDSTVDEWTGFNPSGTPVSTSHTWEEEFTGEIKVKAKDVNCVESPWSEPLSISMPKNKQATMPILQKFFELFPNAFPLLRYILVGL